MATRTAPTGHVGAHETARVLALAAAQEFLETLDQRGLSVATAESLTAGLIASTLVDVPRLSGLVYGGCIVYDSDAKRVMLKVATPNVYSEACAAEMATGLLAATRASVAVAVTGHASVATPADFDLLGVVDVGVAVRQAGPDGKETAPVVRTRRVAIGQEGADAGGEGEGDFVDPDTTQQETERDRAVTGAFVSAFTANAGNCTPPVQCAPLVQLFGVRDYIRHVTVVRALRFALRVVRDLTEQQVRATVVAALPFDGRFAGCGEPSRVLATHLPVGAAPPAAHPPSDHPSPGCPVGPPELNARKRQRLLWRDWQRSPAP